MSCTYVQPAPPRRPRSHLRVCLVNFVVTRREPCGAVAAANSRHRHTAQFNAPPGLQSMNS